MLLQHKKTLTEGSQIEYTRFKCQLKVQNQLFLLKVLLETTINSVPGIGFDLGSGITAFFTNFSHNVIFSYHFVLARTIKLRQFELIATYFALSINLPDRGVCIIILLIFRDRIDLVQVAQINRAVGRSNSHQSTRENSELVCVQKSRRNLITHTLIP